MFASECHHIIGIDDIRTGQSQDVAQFHHWAELVDGPADIGGTAAASAKVGRDDLACLIYTSGTGGAPRGVRQHHGMILHNVEGCIDIISTDFGWDEEVFLSFLPASHAYEHTGGQHFPVALGAEIYYAESLEKLAANIEEVKPTIMVVVPRLFEMLRAKIMKTIEKDGGLKAYLMDRAIAIEAKRYAGKLNPLDLPMDGILSLTLRKKVAREVRRPDEGDGVGRRAAQPRRRPVLPGDGPADAAGLRPDRGRAGDQLQPPKARHPHGNGRPAAC